MAFVFMSALEWTGGLDRQTSGHEMLLHALVLMRQSSAERNPEDLFKV